MCSEAHFIYLAALCVLQGDQLVSLFLFWTSDFHGATALILYYIAYLLRPCVYIQGSTSFLLTLEAELVSKNYNFTGQFQGPDH